VLYYVNFVHVDSNCSCSGPPSLFGSVLTACFSVTVNSVRVVVALFDCIIENDVLLTVR